MFETWIAACPIFGKLIISFHTDIKFSDIQNNVFGSAIPKSV